VTATEILQCSPKGARREILGIDISPDDALILDYHIRVTDILERSMLLAYNLQMATSGKFCKRGKVGNMFILHICSENIECTTIFMNRERRKLFKSCL
jgi:hypothetical protein